MNTRNMIGSVVGAVIAIGAVPAASAGDYYYGGGYTTVSYGDYCGPTYYAAPVHCAPVYVAPPTVCYTVPRVYHRTYVSRPYYPVHRTYRTYRTYDRGVSVGGYYHGGQRGGRGFGFGFSYRD